MLKHYETHPEERPNWRGGQLSQDNPLGTVESWRQWRKKYNAENHELAVIYSAIRRSRIQQNGGVFELSDIVAMQTAQAGRCYYCERPYGAYHIDHKTPVSRGGTSFPNNLCIACPRCNGRKHDKTEAEFRAYLLKNGL